MESQAPTRAGESGEGPSHIFQRHAGVGIALLCWMIVIALGLFYRRPLLDIENRLIDVRLHLPHRVEPLNQIVYVDIDDRTIEILGRWPWPRSQMAEVITTLNQPRIWGIFIDIVFSEETTSEDDIQLAHALEDCDRAFLGAGFQLRKPGEKLQREMPNSILEGFSYDIRVDKDSHALRASRALAPVALFMAATGAIGPISFVPDEDGVARHLPLMVDLRGRYFPSIDIEIARAILDVRRKDIETVPGRSVILRGAHPPGSGEEADISIPVDSQMKMMINYAGPWKTAFRHYPLHGILRDLLSDNASVRKKAESLLEDKIVFLSAAFTGAADMGPTPFEPLVPLSEIHGHVISSIVNRQFLKRVPAAADMFVSLFLCLALGFISPRLKTLNFSGLCAALIVLWIVCSLALFSILGLVVGIVWPCVAIFVSYGGCAGYLHLKTERERASLRKAFSSYVSPDVLSRILDDPNKLKLGGERLRLSILVLVLENFERFSENAEPEETIGFLTSIYEKACGPILEHGGTVDKFTKDGLIAFFGAPIEQEDHPRSAVRAALSIRRDLAELSASTSGRGQNAVGAKMAINVGFATVGNIGSSMRMDYTVIGKNVNLCIRMAETAAESQILIPLKAFQGLEDLAQVEDCGEVRLDSHSKPLFVLNVTGLKEAAEPAQVPLPAAAEKMRGKKFLGPYTLAEKVGAGSAGTVYKGYDEHLDREVAIKVLFPSLQKARMKDITEEAKILAKLSHPNIVQIYYAGEEDGIGFLVMEFVDGINLRELLNSEGSLSVSDALDVIIQTSRGLNAAHKEGVIHRDIKPANLLANNYDIIKIADFGLAGPATAGHDGDRRVAGTFQYISPEQAQGLKVDCRSDIYSLGITFFHLLAGEPPFKADSTAGLAWHQAESELPVDPLKDKGVPASLISVISKMTAKLPRERYADYLDILADLDKVEAELST